MKNRIVLIFQLALALTLFSCKKFEDFQVDPNRTTLATPDLLLPTIEQAAFNEVNLDAALSQRQLVYTDGISNAQYYGWTRGSFADFNNLRQVARMELEAQRISKPAYSALAKFFKAYFGLRLTLMFGDIPYSQALKGDEGTYTSLYDKQEDVFLAILGDLKQANQMITATTESVQGDIVFKGNMTKWKRLINSFTLRVLINLSKKESNAAINVKQRFVEIVSNPSTYPLLTGNADNAQLTFFDLQGNRYPYFNNNAIQTAYYMDESFVNMLKAFKDPRLFSFASKAPMYASLPANDFNAYGGLSGSASISQNTARVVAGEASKINPRYYNSPVNEPSVAFGYAELQFILAEAVVRGWIAGSADTYYKNGIQASMEFYGIDAASINAYKARPEIQLTAGNELQSIITQKYIASFMNSDRLGFYEQRRTGFPAFNVSGAGILNGGQVPKRWMYPENELQLNQAAIAEAIQRQFPSGDNVNGIMWLLQ